MHRARNASGLVEDTLRDLALTQLAPLPPLGADKLVKMLVGNPHAPEPDLCFAIANLFKLRAACEVQEVGGAGGLGLALGNGKDTVKNESDCFQTRFPEVLG